MLLSILVTFSLLVIVIGITTAKLNAKAPCDHNWVETENHDLKCSKCLRTIRHNEDSVIHEPEVNLIQERPARPEGLKLAKPFFHDTDLRDA